MAVLSEIEKLGYVSNLSDFTRKLIEETKELGRHRNYEKEYDYLCG